VTCYFFRDFMVKEVDMGEKGAERLAIVPTGKSKVRTCSRLREPGEKAVNPDDWTGYFMGVKGDLVFFSADDGWNGGIGFAVFESTTGKKIFEDVALGAVDVAGDAAKKITLRYGRVVEAGCVLPKDEAACWDGVRKKLALDGGAPDCKAGYEKSIQAMLEGRCPTQNSDNARCIAKEAALARDQAYSTASAISYPVEVQLAPAIAIRPTGNATGCWPVD
jgi:hypothetical protein